MCVEVFLGIKDCAAATYIKIIIYVAYILYMHYILYMQHMYIYIYPST